MSGDPRSLRCKHLCDPHSFLTVTFWLLDNFSSTGGEYHSHLLSLSDCLMSYPEYSFAEMLRCILQPQPTGLQDTHWWGSYSSVEMQSVYSEVSADWAVFVLWLEKRVHIYLAVELLFCELLPPRLVQYCSQHSCVIAVKLFLQTFSQRPCSAFI